MKKYYDITHRLIISIIGMIIFAIGINIIISVNWGYSTFDTAVQTIQHLFSIKLYGDASLYFNLIFVMSLIILMKALTVNWKDIVTSTLIMYLFTRSINIFSFVSMIKLNNVYLNFIFFFLGFLSINIGIYAMCKGEINAPYDKLVFLTSKKFDKDLGIVRLIFDTSIFAFAVVLIYFYDLDVVIGFGTLFIVFLSGPFISLLNKLDNNKKN